MNEALFRQVAAIMDLRHAAWNAPGRPCVNIVESPSSADLLAECQEGMALHAALRQAHIPSRHYLATTKETFKLALDYIAAQRHFAVQQIVLHISCHGNDEGIGLTSSEFLSWDDLRSLLVNFGVKSCSFLGPERISTLLLCMSSCFGLAAERMSAGDERPFMALVGPSRAANWSDTLASFLAFYNLFLLKDKPCPEAVRAMNTVAGEDDLFHLVDFTAEVRSWVVSNSPPPSPGSGNQL
jgi:hypothetical protein